MQIKPPFKDKENDIEMSEIDLKGYFNNHEKNSFYKRDFQH